VGRGVRRLPPDCQAGSRRQAGRNHEWEEQNGHGDVDTSIADVFQKRRFVLRMAPVGDGLQELCVAVHSTQYLRVAVVPTQAWRNVTFGLAAAGA
jgi:hypothetical protein